MQNQIQRLQIKIYFDNNIRRCSFNTPPIFSEFLETFHHLFRSETNPQNHYKFEYIDSEEDRVAVDCDIEWREMLYFFKDSKLIKVVVTETKKEPQPEGIPPKICGKKEEEQRRIHEIERMSLEDQRWALQLAEEKRVREEKRVSEEVEKKMRDLLMACKETDRRLHEEAERKAQEEAERKAQEEAARKAQEEVERKVKEEAERKAQEEADKKTHEEAEKRAITEKNNKIVAKYALQLHQLYEMGYTDIARNLKLLMTFNGSIEDVVNTLCHS